MKSSLRLTCARCGQDFTQEFSGSQPPEYAHCTNPECNAAIYLVEPLGNFVAMLMMERARHELSDGDNTIAILLGAVAVESEMAYLFFKWKGIDSEKLPIDQTQSDRDAWETEWAEMRSVGKRLDELSRLLTGMDFDKFEVRNRPTVVMTLDEFDPATSSKKFFQEQLFEIRNQIVHYGEIDFQKPDSQRCLLLASSLLDLLHAMDRERIKKMDEDHKKAGQSAS